MIDTTPDFRQQALRAGPRAARRRSILTHGHADHILGFDDIRPFNIRQNSAMPVYGSEETFEVVRRAFAYVFDGRPTLQHRAEREAARRRWSVRTDGRAVCAGAVVHGDLEVLGFRFGRAAYITDFGSMPESSLALTRGSRCVDHRRVARHTASDAPDRRAGTGANRAAEAAAGVVHAHRPRFVARGNQRAAPQAGTDKCRAGVRRIAI